MQAPEPEDKCCHDRSTLTTSRSSTEPYSNKITKTQTQRTQTHTKHKKNPLKHEEHKNTKRENTTPQNAKALLEKKATKPT